MIIINQNRDEIVNFDNISRIKIFNYDNCYKIYAITKEDDRSILLGIYESINKAKEVIKNITKTYGRYMQLNGEPAILQGESSIAPAIFNIPKVYEMP